MINTKFNISDVENFATNLLSGVCMKTFIGNFPKSISDNDKSIMVISVVSPMRDFNAYGKVQVLVEIFCREKAGGIKDIAAMRALQNSFVSKINGYSTGTSDFIITVDDNLSFCDYDEQKGMHVTLNYLIVLIKQ